jgi:D-alanine-D-alanine ligase
MTSKGRLRVAMLVGGRTAEHSNSIDSGDFVRASLHQAGYEVSVIGISRSGQWLRQPDDVPLQFDGGKSEIITGKPISVGGLNADVAFPVLHGPYGEDGTVQGLLEMIDMPYVGCGVFASAAAKDKAHANRLLEAAGLPRAPWRVLMPGDAATPVDEFTPPVFVKPARCGGSLGVSLVRSWDKLAEAVAEARRYDPKVIVEQGLPIRDVECGVVEFVGQERPVASVAGETIAGRHHEFLSYEAKFFDPSVQLLAPAPLDAALTEKVQTMAVDAFLALGCTGLSRVDMFVTDDESVLVNEVTTMPGFSRVSNFAKMWQASGLGAPALVDALVKSALDRKATSDLPL